MNAAEIKKIKELIKATNRVCYNLEKQQELNCDDIRELEVIFASGDMLMKAYKNQTKPFYTESLENVVNALIQYNDLLSSKEIASPIKAKQLRQMLKPKDKNEDTCILIPIKKELYDAFIDHCTKNNESVRFAIHKAIKKHMKNNA